MSPALQRARWGVAITFAIHGAILGNWITRIPAVQQRLELDEGALGMALLGMAIGSVAVTLGMRRMLQRTGSAWMTRISSLAYCMVLVLPAFAPSLPMLVAALFVLGVAKALMTVSMNALAVEVERSYERPIMSSFHAMFSIGAMAGTFCSSAIAAAHVSPELHLVGASLVLAAASAIIGPWLQAGAASGSIRPVTAPAHRGLAMLSGRVLGLGLIAFFIMCSEGAMADWSAVYLTSVGAGPGLAGIGYAVYATFMTGGRLLADALTLRFGPMSMVRGGTLLAATGLTLALISPVPALILIGFACVGAGYSSVIPLVASAAGRTQVGSTNAAAGSLPTVMIFGYVGMLIGPLLLGNLADAFTLRAALGVLILFTMIATTMAGAVTYSPAPSRVLSRGPQPGECA